MSDDARLYNEVSSFTLPEFKELVLANVSEGNRELVQEDWIWDLYNDPELKSYPVLQVIGGLERQAARAKFQAGLHEKTFLVLPGSEIISFNQVTKERTSKGWRPTLIDIETGKMIQGTLWGNRVDLWEDRELQRPQRRRVELPCFHYVTVVGQEEDYESELESGTKIVRKSFMVNFIKGIDAKPVQAPQLINMLDSLAVMPAQLKDTDYLTTVILKGKARWFSPLMKWTESATEVELVDKMDAEGNIVHERHKVTGAMVAMKERVPKRERDLLGQHLVQERPKITDDENEPVRQTHCYQMTLGDPNNPDLPLRVQPRFENNMYADTFHFFFNDERVFVDAGKCPHDGKGGQSDPFSFLADRLVGSDIFVIGSVSRWDKAESRRAGQQEQTYVNISAGFVMDQRMDREPFTKHYQPPEIGQDYDINQYPREIFENLERMPMAQKSLKPPPTAREAPAPEKVPMGAQPTVLKKVPPIAQPPVEPVVEEKPPAPTPTPEPEVAPKALEWEELEKIRTHAALDEHAALFNVQLSGKTLNEKCREIWDRYVQLGLAEPFPDDVPEPEAAEAAPAALEPGDVVVKTSGGDAVVHATVVAPDQAVKEDLEALRKGIIEICEEFGHDTPARDLDEMNFLQAFPWVNESHYETIDKMIKDHKEGK